MKHEYDTEILKKEFFSARPFPHLVLSDFFENEQILEVLMELSKEKFTKKETDLFKFSQTMDLKNTTNPVLKKLMDYVYSDSFIEFIESITGFKLKKTADIAGTLYADTDFLLIHDDQLEGRKIAFLIYLSDMSEEDGGAFCLFDENKRIKKKLYPNFNVFFFFEVSERSYHAVEEILHDTQRIAIGGWFYEDKL